ncbi:MAG: hypothetical protein Q9223_004598 [Gallowayella weberi]
MTTATAWTPEQVHDLLSTPAGSPPPGVLPNFQNPRNLDGAVIVAIVLCITISGLATLMRVCTKAFIIRSFAYEDYAITLGWIVLVADAVLFWISNLVGGHGAHAWDLLLETAFRLCYWFQTTAAVYSPAEFLIRLSILLQYLRVFVPNKRNNRVMFYAIHLLIWCNLIFYLSKFIGLLAICVPRRKLWQPWTEGHCGNPNTWFVASGIFNVISDFAIFVLPLRCIWKLQIPTKKKIMIALVFATGFLACLASIFRTYYSFRMIQGPDWTYNLTLIGMGLLTEMSIGVLVSCLPVLPRFFQHVGPKIIPSCFSIVRPSYPDDDVSSQWRSDRTPSRLGWEMLKGQPETTTTTVTTGSLEDGNRSTDSRAQTDPEAGVKGG